MYSNLNKIIFIKKFIHKIKIYTNIYSTVELNIRYHLTYLINYTGLNPRLKRLTNRNGHKKVIINFLVGVIIVTSSEEVINRDWVNTVYILDSS